MPNCCYATVFNDNTKMKELIKLETALLAKEKGFKTKTVTTKFTNDYLLGGKNVMINETCISLWMCELQKWLREVHNINVFVVACYIGEDKHRYSYYITNPLDTDSDGSEALTYEEALADALNECLQIVPETVA